MFSEHPHLPDGFDIARKEITSQLTPGQRNRLEERANVVGTGIGPRRVDDHLKAGSEPTLIVFVETKLPPSQLTDGDLIPPELTIGDRTVKTDVQEAGSEFTATSAIGDAAPVRSMHIRPLLGGIAGGPDDRNMWGTLTGALIDEDGDRVVMTARHVMGGGTNAPDGRSLVQPSNSHADDPPTVGEVKDYSEFYIDSTARMEVDATTIAVDADDSSGIYLGYDRATDTGESRADRRPLMFSAASGISSGDLLATDVETTITYDDDRQVRYKGLESIRVPRASGMSGSAVGYIDPRTRELTLTGMAFAGSDTRSLVIPWRSIESELGELTPMNRSHEPNPWDL